MSLSEGPVEASPGKPSGAQVDAVEGGRGRRPLVQGENLRAEEIQTQTTSAGEGCGSLSVAVTNLERDTASHQSLGASSERSVSEELTPELNHQSIFSKRRIWPTVAKESSGTETQSMEAVEGARSSAGTVTTSRLCGVDAGSTGLAANKTLQSEFNLSAEKCTNSPLPQSLQTDSNRIDGGENGAEFWRSDEDEQIQRLQRSKERLLAVYFGSVIRGEVAEVAASTWLAKRIFDRIGVRRKQNKVDFFVQGCGAQDLDGCNPSGNKAVEHCEKWAAALNNTRAWSGKLCQSLFGVKSKLERPGKLSQSLFGVESKLDRPTEEQLQSLPVGVFYSPFRRCVVGNWRDPETRRQIKINFRLEENGFELARGLAIVARHLRCSDAGKVRRVYAQLFETNMPVPPLTPWTNPAGDSSRVGATPKSSARVSSHNNKEERWVTPPCTVSADDVGLSHPSQGLLQDLGTVGKRRTFDVQAEGRYGKRVKKLGLNQEELPIGVFLYNGCYCANWWDRNASRQVKVNFKIDELGVEKAKQMAILSRESRCSCVRSVDEMYMEWIKQRLLYPEGSAATK